MAHRARQADSTFFTLRFAKARLGPVDQKRQQGQVMPMMVIVIGAVLLSLWVMFDSGQLMTERIKLQNTVDNVAYSGSAVVARDLNFAAYTNRAMVANQVAIGQMVGLSSWAAMMETLGENLDYLGDVAKFVPYVGPLIKAMTTAFEKATETLATAADGAANFIIPLNDVVISVLSVAQEGHHLVMAGVLTELSDEVLEANDSQAELVDNGLASVGFAYTEWQGSIARNKNPGSNASETTNQRFDEFAEVVSQSRDPFSERRSYRMGFPLSGNVGIAKWRTEKRGGSDLRKTTGASGRYEWDWTAMDTVSLDVEIGKTFLHCALCFDVPLAWGAAHALADGSQTYNYQQGRYDGAWGDAWSNKSAANMASWNHEKHRLRHNSINKSGLADFYAFKDEAASNSEGPPLIYLARKQGADMRLTDELGAEGDNPLNTGTADGFISAAAKARPHYARPTDLAYFARQDGNFEYGNLYNPFWQPRLADLSNTEKAALAALVGIAL